MIASFLTRYYGVNREELKKFLFLGAIFAFTIGIYWMLRPLKDSIFCTIVGVNWVPTAKIVSLFVVVPLAMAYSMVVDRYPRHRIFYALCTIYGVLALVFAYFFAHPVYGLSMENVSRVVSECGEASSSHLQLLTRMLGWAFYVYVESFGSLMVVLFWGFAADTTRPESAKAGFGLVAMGAQFGGILGPWAVSKWAKSLGEAVLLFGGSIATFVLAFMIYGFMRSVPKELLEGYKAKQTPGSGEVKKKTGLLEGAKLLISQPYLLSIFSVIALYEVINTIFDFRLKALSNNVHAGTNLSAFLGDFGWYVNVVGFVCLLLGISNIGRKLGVQKSLLILPTLVAIAVVVVYLNPNSLSMMIAVNVVVKALNYAFNQPVKEQLYIPTTKDTKYKAKAWTEMFGSRGSKAGGSIVNAMKSKLTPDNFILFSSGLALGLIALWVVAAMYVGRKHKEAIDSDTVVC